jgi:hypothetical protein
MTPDWHKAIQPTRRKPKLGNPSFSPPDGGAAGVESEELPGEKVEAQVTVEG